ncbi:polyphosphate kinase 1 [Cyanobacterium sp. IPPAS B-1200]|uniref:polyphosphate kinase 1 n=1 Tax=Cyanobacterium sp. IPPAS B-1200 TaxID=1562720 RepID=UPI0008524B3B|nr:polyphosphate kinase 1 [Cyanobacterium sp. IPPAS B-1200]OEJ79453.1 RNA degradosome polyphosphate kinase [Cyanobacterium sp. IPPAS B-1200]
MTETETMRETKIDLRDSKYYFNRELSWLEFNRRVLHEALDERTLLLERLKFTAIFSANLDEFFMVRVAAIKRQIEAEVTKKTFDGSTPIEQMENIQKYLRPVVQEQVANFEYNLKKELVHHGIHLINFVDLNQEQRKYLHDYYESNIFPVLTPLAVDPSHPFPHISNLSLNLAVLVRNPDTGAQLFARVKVPKSLPRFVAFPDHLRQVGEENHDNLLWVGVPLEQVIAHNLESLFPGMDVQEYHNFRLTRDADLGVQEDEADDLLLAIQQELRKRRFAGSPVRLEVHASMPSNIKKMLMQGLNLQPIDVYEIEGLLGLNDLFALTGFPLPELKDNRWSAVVPPPFDHFQELLLDQDDDRDEHISPEFFAMIRKSDLMVHHPYHSFSSTVQEFITQSAHDPDVMAIKMTLYRTSGDSPIIKALIEAAENGKQVVALVELKARFDEENNILWARKLEKAGVHVVYGLVGLKTHTKIVLVVRKDEDKIRRYVHIGTGNYNPKTAKLYTDIGLFSCREDLGADLTDLFNYLTGYSKQKAFRKLLVAPVTMRDRMIAMIEREANHCRDGGTGRIVAKMNSLVDVAVIEALYQASQAGVKIDLIIRGICCLRPGIEGVSENIKVISIIGRFLEHSRIFYFHNNGEEEIYIGSADWMTRNLSRRVEAITPVEEPKLMKQLEELLGLMLSDNRQSWELQTDGSYIQRRPKEGEIEHSTHQILMDMAQNG